MVSLLGSDEICAPTFVSEFANATQPNKQATHEFIKKSQIQTTPTKDAYLEWISFDCIGDWRNIYMVTLLLPLI